MHYVGENWGQIGKWCTKIWSTDRWTTPHTSKKFYQNPFIIFWDILHTDTQAHTHTDHYENITSFLRWSLLYLVTSNTAAAVAQWLRRWMLIWATWSDSDGRCRSYCQFQKRVNILMKCSMLQTNYCLQVNTPKLSNEESHDIVL